MAGKLIIIGAGGHGRVCAEVAKAAGLTVVGFCDTGKGIGETVNAIPVVASGPGDLPTAYGPSETELFIAIGDNDRRAELSAEAADLGYRLPALMHPSAIVSETASVGDGTVLMPAIVINANSRIGRGCIVNTAATLDHDNALEDFVQISPGVHSAGTVRYGARTFVGTGAAIIPGISIGVGAVIGAGATVVRDVADGVRVVGVPAVPI